MRRRKVEKEEEEGQEHQGEMQEEQGRRSFVYGDGEHFSESIDTRIINTIVRIAVL